MDFNKYISNDTKKDLVQTLVKEIESLLRDEDDIAYVNISENSEEYIKKKCKETLAAQASVEEVHLTLQGST